MNKQAFAGLFLIIVIGAAGLRLTDLGLRPMHHDEANQALKFGALLDSGDYRYDKADHHGPSLYYISYPFARALGAKSLAALLVPAAFGIGAVLLLLLFVPLIGREATLGSALALALSPVMAYFSRFYIQETLLLFFLTGFIASLWRYRSRPSWAWAAAAGVFAGLMYATKETSVIAFGSIAAAFLLSRLMESLRKKGTARTSMAAEELRQNPEGPIVARITGGQWKSPQATIGFHLILGLGFAFFVSLLLFTSFFQNPRGWLDSILSFKIYFVRAGEAGFHVQPWDYYLRTLAFSKSGSGPAWSEGLILILAAVGIAAAFRRRSAPAPAAPFARFLFFYTLFSTAAYSLIPYKTPWNVLPFYLGFILLAGTAAAALLAVLWRPKVGAPVFLLLAAGFVHLGIQAWRASFAYPADPRNPYVYAQTSPDLLKLVRRVEELSAVHPDREKMLIPVIAGPYTTWPLPWYFRRFSRVGYWTDAARAGPLEEAPLVIADTEQAELLESRLLSSFQSEYYELRPNIFLILHIRFDLWEEYLNSRGQK